MKKINSSLYRDTFKITFFKDCPLAGEYNFPAVRFVKMQQISNVIPFNVYHAAKNKPRAWVHFFIDDYQFERVWSNPKKYLPELKKAEGVVTTDFSMFTDMPRAIQIYNCYRNRAFASFLQRNGVNIIPVVGWSDSKSFNFCFDGIAYGSAVAISSNGALQNPQSKELFIAGYNKLLETINPEQVVFIGPWPKELCLTERVCLIKSFSSQKFAKFKRKE